MTRRYVFLAMLLTLALVLAACASDGDDTAGEAADDTAGEAADDTAADEAADDEAADDDSDVAAGSCDGTFPMGLAMPLTGSQAALGEEFVRWAEDGVADVNEARDFELELITEDTEATAEVGLTALNRLAAVEDVPIVFTAWSGVVQAMAPVAADLDVALINNAANDPNLAGVGELINIFPLASVDIEALATWAREVQGYERAAVIYIDNATGEGAADLYEEVFTELGGEVVAVESVRQEATDASAQVARALDADPDIVHVHVLAGEAPVVIQELDRQGYEGDMSTYTIAEFEDVRESAGSAMAGMYYSTLSPERTSELEDAIAWYEETYDSSPAISYGVYEYASPFFYADVVEHLCENGQEVTGENITQAVYDIGTFDLPHIGEIEIREDGTITLPVRIKQVGEDPSAGAADDEVVYEVDPL